MQTQTINDADHTAETRTKELYAQQIELEKLFNKNQLHRRIQKEFVECEIPFTEVMEANGIPLPFGYDLLTQMQLHKRTDVPTLVGILRRHMKGDGQATADMIRVCVEAELLKYDVQLRQFIVHFEITRDVQEELDRFQFPLPMVVKPQPVKGNNETGYILGTGSLLLRDNHHSDDICLDHINRVNQVPFSIDLKTALMVQNQWKSLDKQKSDETKADFERRRKAFARYDQASKDVMKLLTHLDNRHFVTHKYDKRGRTYCMGYHVNYQGTEWNKAVIQLANKEFIE